MARGQLKGKGVIVIGRNIGPLRGIAQVLLRQGAPEYDSARDGQAAETLIRECSLGDEPQPMHLLDFETSIQAVESPRTTLLDARAVVETAEGNYGGQIQ